MTILCRDLGRAIFGEKRGNWAIALFQWSVLVGLAITYTATAGQSLQVSLVTEPLLPDLSKFEKVLQEYWRSSSPGVSYL